MHKRNTKVDAAASLNDGKTEVICFISKHNITTFCTAISCPFSVGSSNIIPASRIRYLGAIMDQQLSMIDQVTAVRVSCNYHLRRLSSVRRYLTRCAVQALITSQLDFCNSLLLRLTLAQIECLQWIRNKAARLVTRTRQRDHITRVAGAALATCASPNRI